MNDTSKAMLRWADVAMWEAEPLAAPDQPVKPRVTLVHMTANPLRVMAAAAETYQGRTVRDPDDVSYDTAMRWFSDMTRTKLQAALEFIDLHFLLEGVTRAFTHQLVRQRTAVYVQESMRFAVKTNASCEVAMPPSIARLREDAPARRIWDDAVARISWAYGALVDAGIPAEDARGLLPTNIATRVHYKTNLRNLAEQSGMRLCSQAQYEWKLVWSEMLDAIMRYGPDTERWQQMSIVGLFKPVCYQTGRCGFRGEADRACVIRDRVEAHHAAGVPPEEWIDINPLEPLLEGAARVSGRE